MSKTTFRVEYANPMIPLEQLFSVLTEIAREMEYARKVSMTTLRWVENANARRGEARLDANRPMFEVNVPPEFTKDSGVLNEVLRVVPIDDKTIQVVITDASLPPEKCEDVAIDFAQRLYEKATGRKIGRDEIAVRGVASLEENVCEHCLRKIEGFPYVCKVCGRTFCYEHRHPQTHGCQLKRMTEETEPPVRPPAREHESTAGNRENRPAVTVRRLPCG